MAPEGSIERLVLGIHDLPGGFGPWMLVPVHGALPIPDALPSATAVLVEPFAAALRAVERIAPRKGDRIGVLGPRRLVARKQEQVAVAGLGERGGRRALLLLAARLGHDGGQGCLPRSWTNTEEGGITGNGSESIPRAQAPRRLRDRLSPAASCAARRQTSRGVAP